MMRSILHMAAPVVTMAMIATATVPAEAGAVRDQLAAQLSQRLFPLFDAVGEDARHMRTLRADPALSAAHRSAPREATFRELLTFLLIT